VYGEKLSPSFGVNCGERNDGKEISESGYQQVEYQGISEKSAGNRT